MPLFSIPESTFISRNLVSYKCHEDCFGILVDLDSRQYKAFLPEIVVHKTTDNTNKTKPLAIVNVTDTARGRISPFA